MAFFTPLPMPMLSEPIYRRDFQKRDGRWLQLYGFKPHDLPPLHEDDFAVAKGGELRYHPLRREWNVYAPHRQNRTFKPSAADDPLAPTRPNAAATEIPFADFELAVFENKFTNFHPEAPETQDVVGVPTATAKGQCDVVVYTPDAIGNLHSVGQARRKLLLAAWVDRYNYHFAHGADFVLPFESRGEPVGVTLHHPHGQIYAFPNAPNVQANMQQSFEAGYDLAHEIETWSDYDVTRADGIRAVCPPYARFPFEVWLVPDTPVRGPWDFTPEQAEGFAHLLGDITRRYDAHFEGPTAYMLTLHAAPQSAKEWQFTAQFYPLLRAPGRVKYLASVEQGTGMFTVDVMPESAASILKAL